MRLWMSRRAAPSEHVPASGVAARPTADRAGEARLQQRRQEFEQRLQAVLKPLYLTALTYEPRPEDAEDLVQEVVLRAWRSYDRFEPGTSFKAWVLRILTNHCINRFHRAQRQVQEVRYEDAERPAELAGSRLQGRRSEPEAELYDGLLDEEVQAALAALPEEFRVAVVLADVQELSYLEMAQVLEVPLGTVRSRLSRGRRLLRAALTPYALRRGLIREDDLG
ncbi:MAG: sigma-70 family RNA polymerase sigma factor [Fimbriimonadaceae bacterium]|nr:sigma-70 family RNA polymerase sigma factor [Fimbriimonadaceae bacterium]